MFGNIPLDLLTIFVLAFLAETLTEYLARPLFAAPRDGGEEPAPGPLALRYIAAALGIALCIAYRVDLLALLGIDSAWPMVGQIVTGLIVGRGSNYVHDFAGKWLG